MEVSPDFSITMCPESIASCHQVRICNFLPIFLFFKKTCNIAARQDIIFGFNAYFLFLECLGAQFLLLLGFCVMNWTEIGLKKLTLIPAGPELLRPGLHRHHRVHGRGRRRRGRPLRHRPLPRPGEELQDHHHLHGGHVRGARFDT